MGYQSQNSCHTSSCHEFITERVGALRRSERRDPNHPDYDPIEGVDVAARTAERRWQRLALDRGVNIQEEFLLNRLERKLTKGRSSGASWCTVVCGKRIPRSEQEIRSRPDCQVISLLPADVCRPIRLPVTRRALAKLRKWRSCTWPRGNSTDTGLPTVSACRSGSPVSPETSLTHNQRMRILLPTIRFC